MQVWRIDLKQIVRDMPEIRPWMEKNAVGFCVHGLKKGDYVRIRDWLRSEDLRGDRKVIRMWYNDPNGSGAKVEDLTVLLDHRDDIIDFERKWGSAAVPLSLSGMITITII